MYLSDQVLTYSQIHNLEIKREDDNGHLMSVLESLQIHNLEIDMLGL